MRRTLEQWLADEYGARPAAEETSEIIINDEVQP